MTHQKIVLKEKKNMKIKINESDLIIESQHCLYSSMKDECEPYCKPNCDPTCNPVCSPSCYPCYPGNHCNPETFYYAPDRD